MGGAASIAATKRKRTPAVDDDDNVEKVVTDGTPIDQVIVKLKCSTLGSGGNIFSRLKAMITP
jgi:hypothetical protein|tara:strand:+ start:6949 stop:7137 length:189 start_codon:yes stop_codon:yes gene_type:complete